MTAETFSCPSSGRASRNLREVPSVIPDARYCSARSIIAVCEAISQYPSTNV